jgi:VCBS repeat-containing protein
VTVNILGTNDAAEFSAEVADLVDTDIALGTSGQMLSTDVDSPTVFVEQQAVIGQYGVFSIGIDGIWTYDATSAHDEFLGGVTYTDIFSVFSVDGTESNVTVNILGTDDAPVLTAPADINYTDTIFKDTFATVTGQLIASDVDSSLLTYGIEGGIENSDGTISQINEYGELIVNIATGAYTFVANAAAIEPLTVDASASFTVTSSDGLLVSSQSLVIAIAQDGITESIGDDVLTGTAGDDVFDGLAGNDGINGLTGDDAIAGGEGNDTLDGGLGNDTANFGGVKAGYNFTYTAGTIGVTDTNIANGNDGVDTLTNIETLHFADKDLTVNFDREFYLAKYADLRNAFGTNLDAATKHYIQNGFKEGRTVDNGGNDTLNGSESTDHLNGGAGNDILRGNGGDDIINGGIGNDTITGGLGHDILTGGNGFDIFKLINISSDTITDFVVADDTIQLKNLVFTSLNYVGQLQADNFKIGAEATDSNDFIIYNSSTGGLSYDADGNGSGTAVEIAILGVDLGLTNANFNVIV